MNNKGLIAAIALLSISTSSCGPMISKYIRQKRERELGGGGSGEAFAPYYDTDTVITVTGSVINAETFKAKPMGIKSVRIFLKSKRKTWEVHLGPVWYIKKQTFILEPGDEISVTGSRIDDKIMTRQFEKDEHIFILRSEEGQPKWYKSLRLEAGPELQ